MPNVTAEAFILTAEQRSDADSSHIILYAASTLGPLKIAKRFRPYFFVDAAAKLSPSTASKVANEKPIVEQANMFSLSGRPVHKYSFSSIVAAERARLTLLDSRIALFESDVRPRERFMMDLRLNGSVLVEGRGERQGKITYLRDPNLTPAQALVPLRICSLDIETSVSSKQILSVAVHLSGGADERIVFMQSGGKLDPRNDFMAVSDERALLTAFEKWLLDADPDLIIGWNVIGFDLAYLKNRAASHNISLRIGRDRRDFSVNERAGSFSRANVPGRVVLDGPQLLRSSFYSFESYSLEHVAQSVLGEGKLIAPSGNRAWEIERLFKEDPQRLAQYNLKDALLVTRIFERLGLLELTLRRSQLSGMLLDQVGFSTASFDHFYLPRLHNEGYVAPDVGEAGDAVPAAGGYVMEPVAGLYQDIIGLDFRSLYPSIIRTFNIDPLSRACADTDPLNTPAGFKFSRTRSILPGFIGELMNERQRAKETNNSALSQAVKILMNSFYGVMGSLGSRLYHPALPDAITSTGQWLLIESKRFLEEQGNRVIYGDTDSLFVELPSKCRPEMAEIKDAGIALAGDLTQYWAKRLAQEFSVESHLVLEFKKHFKKFVVPSMRGGEGGAKKRYAGLVVEDGTEKIDFVGLEVVRSDWTRLARDFQRELYTRIFKGESIDPWMRDFVAQVKRGAFDDKLVYRKRLHKSPEEYGASPPPYVRAALMLPKAGREVRYVMTTKGPIPVELNPTGPDYSHYIERQLRPIADSILEVIGTSFEKLLSAQLGLFASGDKPAE